MGACSSGSLTVEAVYNGKKTTFTTKNMIELRLHCIKFFSITRSFLIMANGIALKSSSDLFSACRQGKILRLNIEIVSDLTRPHKSQVRIGNRLGIMYLGKYCIFPADLSSEASIEKNVIYIGNEIFQLKAYYQHLDIPGLALGKVKKEKRKVECLEITDEACIVPEDLTVYKNEKKVLASGLKVSKSSVAALAYDHNNTPKAVIAWRESNLIISLFALKTSVHFAINFSNLPDESLALNMSILSTSMLHLIYSEYACFYKDGKIITYHPNDYSVTFYKFEKDLEKYSITQTPIGFIIHQDQTVLNFTTSSIKTLPNSQSFYRLHSGLLHQSLYIALGGSLTCNVEALDLYALKWTNLPSLPCIIESPTSCSVAKSIYLIGGIVNGNAVDTVWKLGIDWECLTWKLPWSTSKAGVFTIGKEIIIFGGVQNDKDKFVVIDNEKEIASGYIGTHATFQGLQCGRVNFDIVICSNQGVFFKYDNVQKRFYIVSIGNYMI